VKFNYLLKLTLYQLQMLRNVERSGNSILKTERIKLCKKLVIYGGAYGQEGWCSIVKWYLQENRNFELNEICK